MRILTSLAGVFALVLLLSAGTARAQGFLSVYDDLPLPSGLNEMTDSGLSFDTPGGRIVEAYARGPVAAATVIRFYATTLPQLGWAAIGPSQFKRDNETLRLEIQTEGRDVVVHFVFAPE